MAPAARDGDHRLAIVATWHGLLARGHRGIHAMALRLSALLLLLFACVPAVAAADVQAGRYRVVGYATEWNAIDARTLDRIYTLIFAFAHVEQGRVVLPDGALPRL